MHRQSSIQNLPVVVAPLPGVQSVMALLLCKTGSRYEEEQTFGVAHFLEHMVFKGTKSFPLPQDLSIAIDGIGGEFNAFTSKEYTGYYVHAVSHHLPLMIRVLFEMLRTPLLRQEDVDRERGVILEELRMYQDRPESRLANAFDEFFYAGTGLAHPIVGTESSLPNITADSLRELLASWYHPENLTLVLTGDAAALADDAAIASLVSDQMAVEPSYTATKRKKVSDFLGKNVSTGERELRLQKKTEQAHIVTAWRGIARGDARRYTARLLAIILGGTMSSRLFTEVREERGLGYYVHSDLDSYLDHGSIGFSMGVDTKRAQEAIDVASDVMCTAADPHSDEPITQAELDRAKEYAVGKLALQLESPDGMAEFLGLRYTLDGELLTQEEIVKHYRAVSLEDIHDLASDLIHEKEHWLGTIGV